MDFINGASQMVAGAFDTNGNFFPLDSLAQHFNRDANGAVTSIVATNDTHTWTQTYTYTNGMVSDISGWVKA